MRANEFQQAEDHGTAASFATTDWSMVLTARGADSPQAEDALEDLCRTYWYPLYAYVRGRGYRPEEAQDLTQEFFSRLIAKRFLQRVEQSKGRFRSFLLACMKHFLADEWDKAHAVKRGGKIHFLSWDAGIAETRVQQDLNLALSPEKLFARRWALTVLDVVKARLQAYYLDAGKKRLYDQIYPYLRGDSGQPTHADTGRQLDMKAAAVEAAVRRMRRRYELWLREEIARTVNDGAEVDDELRFLLSALAG